jgi:hypothetical protein
MADLPRWLVSTYGTRIGERIALPADLAAWFGPPVPTTPSLRRGRSIPYLILGLGVIAAVLVIGFLVVRWLVGHVVDAWSSGPMGQLSLLALLAPLVIAGICWWALRAHTLSRRSVLGRSFAATAVVLIALFIALGLLAPQAGSEPSGTPDTGSSVFGFGLLGLTALLGVFGLGFVVAILRDALNRARSWWLSRSALELRIRPLAEFFGGYPSPTEIPLVEMGLTRLVPRLSLDHWPPIRRERVELPERGVQPPRLGAYRELAAALPAEHAAEYRRLARGLGSDTIELVIEPGDGLHGPCWEAMVALAVAGDSTAPCAVPFRFRRTATARRIAHAGTATPSVPGGESVPSRVTCWAESEVANQVAQRGWKALAGDTHFEVQVSRADDLQRLAFRPDGVHVLHLIGTAEETNAGVRFRVVEDQASRVGKASLDVEAAPARLVRAEDVGRIFPSLALCIIQGVPGRPDPRRLESDRYEAMLARAFAGELFALGVPAVIVVPPLGSPVAVAVLERLAAALQPRPRGARTLQEAVVAACTRIVAPS